MTFIKSTELNTYVVIRIKSDGRSERIESFHDNEAAKSYVDKLLIDQPGNYGIITIKGGMIQ